MAPVKFKSATSPLSARVKLPGPKVEKLVESDPEPELDEKVVSTIRKWYTRILTVAAAGALAFGIARKLMGHGNGAREEDEEEEAYTYSPQY